MADRPTRVLMTATSYPGTETAWEGLFIRKIADAMGENSAINLSLWAPDGPRHARVHYACTASEAKWLADLLARGGIAHLLRKHPLKTLVTASGLLWRLRRLYLRERQSVDIFHINWLQNALPLYGMNVSAVMTVLGTDFKLLKIPGMVRLVRAVLKTNRCVLAPNAAWMNQPLQNWFGDIADIRPVNFGIDSRWYGVINEPPADINYWLCVLRVTPEKIGHLFEWGKSVFNTRQQLHLFGPNHDNLSIPDWVNYHGPATADELLSTWYPRCAGFITLSEHSEGKPQVLLETMGAGIPIIASDIPAHREVVSPGVHGYLVDSRAQFIDAMTQLSEPEQRRRFSANCRRSGLEEYGTWSDCVARYRNLYGMLL
ncbi:MAG: glycosyltransferase family 4 protein [Halieaceae bacterium]|jgi:glycosyltransferase involved in cell wall biosynthesis|nr:glycosyltransferase family 4 protein [Halieaceae bacterium]